MKIVSDQEVQESIIDPAGGIEKFRLIVCPSYKLIQYLHEEGNFLDLIIEDDDLASATISLLEKSGVPEIHWKVR
ncbi:hypothetical protein [Chitinimonas sp. BJB300]|uniref:hypothetical protein n=1 Tax=Chitinimonas sp. BJB300 TaxID=1559339 RepID=UPI000C102734|nr:hypothetical protein [Chitinimonas sp. BJB300]PHV09956.1 hypothetical protein CSQ89_18805 [Chitinimonas sp. BJB300]TSJ84656.1 hypothetical protein FG002_019245 [Chitinimonas sp. BJB300]